MTAWRQENKGRRAIALYIAGVFGAVVTLWSPAVGAAGTERVIADRFTGLAIGGYDPVAYFTDGSAVAGLPDFEASQGNAIWRFRSDRNRAEFLAHPDIYGPQFGGYDALDLSCGTIVAGRPAIWLVSGQRLYLFQRADNRDAFAADPSRADDAARHWPVLRDSLADY